MRTYVNALVLVIFLLAGCKSAQDQKVEKPVLIYREKDYTLAEIADQLLKFGKYEIALELVQEDTSLTADGIRCHAYDGLGNTREAIRYAIPYLRTKDTDDFYEGSYECCDLYEIFKKDAGYALKLLESEYRRCLSNYQVRQLMMNLYWYLDDYDAVVRMGDEFREELPNMPNEVTFNCLHQSALDALDLLKRVCVEVI